MNTLLESEGGLTFNDVPDEIIIDKLFNDCAPWIRESQGKLVYRGMSPDGRPKITQLYINTDRRPTDTPRQAQDAINKMFTKMGFTANRSNSIFVSGNPSQAAGYGIQNYVIFPIGTYSYTWSKDVKDFYREMSDSNMISLYYDLSPKAQAELDKKMEERKIEAKQPGSPSYGMATQGLFWKRGYYLDAMRNEEGSFNPETLFRYFGSKYSNKHLRKAIMHEVEIMIAGGQYYAIEYGYWNQRTAKPNSSSVSDAFKDMLDNNMDIV